MNEVLIKTDHAELDAILNDDRPTIEAGKIAVDQMIRERLPELTLDHYYELLEDK